MPFFGLRLSGMFQSLPGAERSDHLPGDPYPAADAHRGVGERAAERTGHLLQPARVGHRVRDTEARRLSNRRRAPRYMTLRLDLRNGESSSVTLCLCGNRLSLWGGEPQKSTVTLNRANRGLSTVVGASHVAPLVTGS